MVFTYKLLKAAFLCANSASLYLCAKRKRADLIAENMRTQRLRGGIQSIKRFSALPLHLLNSALKEVTPQTAVNDGQGVYKTYYSIQPPISGQRSAIPILQNGRYPFGGFY
jgi:hypothetical protein